MTGTIAVTKQTEDVSQNGYDSPKPEDNVNNMLLSDVFPEGSNFKRDLNDGKDTDTENGHKGGELTTTEESGKRKRRRKLFSCDSCRNLKTKCTSEPGEMSCRRCKRLVIPCSLPRASLQTGSVPSNAVDIELDPSSDRKGVDSKSEINNSLTKLFILQQNNFKLYESLQQEMIKQSDIMQRLSADQFKGREEVVQQAKEDRSTSRQGVRQLSTDGSVFSLGDPGSPPVANFADLYDQLPVRDDINAPLNLISEVKTTVLGKMRTMRTTDLQKATEKFIQFYMQEETSCLELAKEFLEISHYYIIPGGISDIDRAYVLEHPMITCVFVLIAMLSSKKYKHSKIQLIVEGHMKEMISTINNRDPLSDHDIESILYICLYNIGRLDKWMLSATGLMHFFISIDVRGIIDRVVNNNVYTNDDLFHLRILNSLCFTHLQNAIGKGRPMMIGESWWKVHRLTVIFPNATIGDAIQVAQLDLFRVIINLMNDKEYQEMQEKLNFQSRESTFLCEELQSWHDKWSKIILKDVSRIIKYSYYFAYILVSRKFIAKHPLQDGGEQSFKAYKTASFYSFELLRNFLESEFKFIRGIPSFQLQEIVYACVTLFEYLNHMSQEEKERTMNMISKTYWHLNKMGQELNDATGTIAEIIKKLVEMARKNEALQIAVTRDKGFIGSGSVTRADMYKRRKNSQQQKKLSPEDLPLFSGEMNHAKEAAAVTPPAVPAVAPVPAAAATVSPPSAGLYQLPDLSNFSNFDDFFRDLFREQQ